MTGTAIVKGKIIRFRLSKGLALAQSRNRGKSMAERQAVEFVETKRRRRLLRSAKPYLEAHS
jgi:hypothetical protein